MEPMIGEIRLFAGNFVPKNWAFCDGQLLPIDQHKTLFSIIGTTYGGDGTTTFALPDLRGRVPVHAGTGAGLSTRKIGQKSGTETNSLTINQLPAHSHATKTAGLVSLSSTIKMQNVTTANSDGDFLSLPEKDDKEIVSAELSQGGMMQKESIIEVEKTGNSYPINNMPPFAVINYIIALDGSFPLKGR